MEANPEAVHKIRPLNARLVREFIKYPRWRFLSFHFFVIFFSLLVVLFCSNERCSWEVNGRKSAEGEQAVLIPSEAAQGYLLPVPPDLLGSIAYFTLAVQHKGSSRRVS